MSQARRRNSRLNSAPRAEDKKRLQRPRREAGTTRRHRDAGTRNFPNPPNPLAATAIGTGPRPRTMEDDPSASAACSGPTVTRCRTACVRRATATSLPRDAAATLLPIATKNCAAYSLAAVG